MFAVVLVSVWAIRFPLLAEAPVTLPAGAIAIVQAKVVVGVVLLNAIFVVPAEQIVCATGVAVTLGVGLTVTTTSIGTPGQPLAVGVTV